MKTLLTEAVTVLCKNGISYQHNMQIDCLLGVTIDYDKVILITIAEEIQNESTVVPPEGEFDVVSQARLSRGDKDRSRKRKYVIQLESDREEEDDFCPEPTPKKRFHSKSTTNTREFQSLDDGKRVYTTPHVYGKHAVIYSHWHTD